MNYGPVFMLGAESKNWEVLEGLVLRVLSGSLHSQWKKTTPNYYSWTPLQAYFSQFLFFGLVPLKKTKKSLILERVPHPNLKKTAERRKVHCNCFRVIKSFLHKKNL
jgi:hypothetical protein